MFIFFLIVVLLVPTITIIFGIRWINHAPEKISNLYGYRTEMSMKNQGTWKFAHKFIGKIWLLSGIPLGIASIIILFTFIKSDIETLGIVSLILVGCQAVGMGLPIFPTEYALRKNFDKNGYPKKQISFGAGDGNPAARLRHAFRPEPKNVPPAPFLSGRLRRITLPWGALSVRFPSPILLCKNSCASAQEFQTVDKKELTPGVKLLFV